MSDNKLAATSDACKADLLIMHHHYGLQCMQAITALGHLLEMQGRRDLAQAAADKGWQEGAAK